jgi:hypothetical protein
MDEKLAKALYRMERRISEKVHRKVKEKQWSVKSPFYLTQLCMVQFQILSPIIIDLILSQIPGLNSSRGGREGLLA